MILLWLALTRTHARTVIIPSIIMIDCAPILLTRRQRLLALRELHAQRWLDSSPAYSCNAKTCNFVKCTAGRNIKGCVTAAAAFVTSNYHTQPKKKKVYATKFRFGAEKDVRCYAYTLWRRVSAFVFVQWSNFVREEVVLGIIYGSCNVTGRIHSMLRYV